MPLTGPRRTDYMRDYMRKKRAGLPTRKERPPQQGPSQRMINQIGHWVKARSPLRLSATAQRVIDGLTLEYDKPENRNVADWDEACRRLQCEWDERKTAKEAKAAEEAEAKKRRCTFCRKTEDEVGCLVGDGFHHICDACIDDCARIVAKSRVRKPKKSRSPRGPRSRKRKPKASRFNENAAVALLSRSSFQIECVPKHPVISNRSPWERRELRSLIKCEVEGVTVNTLPVQPRTAAPFFL